MKAQEDQLEPGVLLNILYSIFYMSYCISYILDSSISEENNFSEFLSPNFKSMNELIPREARFQKNSRSDFFCGVKPLNFENVTLVARRRQHFRGFWAIFLVARLPPKEVF